MLNQKIILVDCTFPKQVDIPFQEHLNKQFIVLELFEHILFGFL